MTRLNAFECTVHFLREERIELYKEYSEGVQKRKNVLGVKNASQRHALRGLERRGA